MPAAAPPVTPGSTSAQSAAFRFRFPRGVLSSSATATAAVANSAGRSRIYGQPPRRYNRAFGRPFRVLAAPAESRPGALQNLFSQHYEAAFGFPAAPFTI